MKKLYSLILLLVSSILMITSCAPKEDPIPTFEGQWELVSAEITNYDTKHVLTGSFSIPISQFAEKDKLEIEFKEGKIISQVSKSGEAVINSWFYRMEGSTLLVKSTVDGPESVFGRYTLTNTDLTIISTEVSDDGEIATKLIYKHK